jgi:hypothetical protein
MDSLKKTTNGYEGKEPIGTITDEQYEEAISDLVEAGIEPDLARTLTDNMRALLPLLEAALEDGDNEAARRLSLIVIPD